MDCQSLMLMVCLAMVALTNVSAASDASLYSYNSEYSIDQFMGGASRIDSCTLYISPLRIKGNVKPIYIPSGNEADIESLYKSSENQLDFTLERHGSNSDDSWSMSISLPNCNPQEQEQNDNSNSAKSIENTNNISKIGVWCHHCSSLENSMLATGTIATTSTTTQDKQEQNQEKTPLLKGGTVVLVINDGEIILPPSRRSLLQAGTATECASYPCTGCSGPLTVGSTSTPFENCVSLAPELQLLYTLTPAGNGASTIFKGGLWAKNSQFYSGFGFSPDNSGSMIGGDAVIVYPDTTAPSGASVTGITMQSYSVSQLNAAKGSYPLTDTAASKNPDGSLSATFSVELPSSIDKLKLEHIVYIYVSNGPMLPGNILGDHTKSLRGSLYGANMLMVDTTAAASSSSSATPSTETTPTATPTTTPTTGTVVAPVVNPQVEEGEGEQEKAGDGDESNAAGTTSTSSSTIPAAITTPSSSSVGSATTTSTTTCSLTIAGEQKTYEACYPARVGTDLQVYYSFDSDPLDSKSSILSMAMKATSTGYVSVGFPSSPGSMTNAGSAILQACSSCPSGASIKEYYMTGTDTSDVFPDNRMNMTDFKASAANGVLSGSWKMKLPGTAATARRRLLQTSYPASAFPLIYAAGPISSSGALISHTIKNSAAGNLNLLQGLPGAGGGSIETDIAPSSSYEDAHMWIATISWGVLIPMAIIMARYFKPHTGKWFAVHRAVAISGFVLAIVALVLGFKANNGWETDKPVHRDLGMACTILGLVQMLAVISKLRPAKDHKHRKYWFFGHAWIGRTAVILAIANIYYGIINVAELGTWAWAVYTVVLGCIVALGLVMEVINWRVRKNSVASSANLNGKSYQPDQSGLYTTEVSAATSRQDSRQLTEIELT